MDIHFNDTATANTSAEALFAVLTDYPSYPSFNSAIKAMTVVRKDDQGAEFLADRSTKVGKQVRAYDTYTRNGDFVVERRYASDPTARSTWTVHPIDESHSTLTIDASLTMSTLRGLVMKPALRHLFYGINFTPFIKEAERRAGSGAQAA